MSKKDKSKISKLDLDSKEDFSEVTFIATDALSYVLSKMAVNSVEYILMFCRERFIIPQVMDTSIIELLRGHNSNLNRSILQTVLQYETIISYENSGSKLIEKLVTEVKQRSVSPSSNKSRDNSIATPEEKSSEEVKAEHELNKLEEPTSSDSHINEAFEYDEVLPKRLASEGEIFQNEHVIEIMFRSKMLSEEQEIDIINWLYGGLKYNYCILLIIIINYLKEYI